MNCHWGGFTGGKWQWNITEQTVLTDGRKKERKKDGGGCVVAAAPVASGGRRGRLAAGDGRGGGWVDLDRGRARRGAQEGGGGQGSKDWGRNL
jgi:hypothetical protein